MNYTKLLKSLLNEATQFKQYKRLPVVIQIMLIICMLPIVAVELVLLGTYFVADFILKGLSTPLDVLHLFVKNERGEVRHATEAVIYAITLPFIFVYNILMALSSLFFYILWFVIMVFTYLLTLGGIRWQPFVMEAKFDEEPKEYAYKPAVGGAIAFAVIIFLAFVFQFVFAWIGQSLIYLFGTDLRIAVTGTPGTYYDFSILYVIMVGLGAVCTAIYSLMLFAVNPIVFRKSKKIALPEGEVSEDAVTENEAEPEIETPADITEEEAEEIYYADEDKGQSVNLNALKTDTPEAEEKRCSGCDKPITDKICPHCGTYN